MRAIAASRSSSDNAIQASSSAKKISMYRIYALFHSAEQRAAHA
jgi:hypothetical protein